MNLVQQFQGFIDNSMNDADLPGGPTRPQGSHGPGIPEKGN